MAKPFLVIYLKSDAKLPVLSSQEWYFESGEVWLYIKTNEDGWKLPGDMRAMIPISAIDYILEFSTEEELDKFLNSLEE